MMDADKMSMQHSPPTDVYEMQYDGALGAIQEISNMKSGNARRIYRAVMPPRITLELFTIVRVLRYHRNAARPADAFRGLS